MVIEFSCKIFFAVIFIYLGIQQLNIQLGLTKPNSQKQFINICLLLSVLLIISQTLFPIRTNIPLSKFEIYNLIPFKVIIDIYNNHSFSYFCYQVFGNIAMFIPFGYFLSLKLNSTKTLLISLLTTLSVEFIQGFIPYRFCDIDDIFLNTLGAYIGILISLINIKVSNKNYNILYLKTFSK